MRQDFATRYAALADWSSALAAENPAMMIDRLRRIVQSGGLPPIYVIIDEYDNFTNELVVSSRDAEYDAICGHDNAGGLPRDSFFKAYHDGYHFIPGAEPLYNSTTCNWYLFNLVANDGMPSPLVIDANVRTDVGWIRRLAGSTANALERVRAYVERGEGESAPYLGLSSRFGTWRVSAPSVQSPKWHKYKNDGGVYHGKHGT